MASRRRRIALVSRVDPVAWTWTYPFVVSGLMVAIPERAEPRVAASPGPSRKKLKKSAGTTPTEKHLVRTPKTLLGLLAKIRAGSFPQFPCESGEFSSNFREYTQVVKNK